MIIIENCSVVDAASPEPREGMSLVIEAGRIRDVAKGVVKSDAARRIDAKGRTALPGLIDAHNHIYLHEVSTRRLEQMPLTQMAFSAVPVLKKALERGFTTMRDAGGADWGTKLAIEQGHVRGPRLFISGQAISQSGGHGDTRYRTEENPDGSYHSAYRFGKCLADGVDEVTKAARKQLRMGVDQIKIMVSGGVASLNDPIDVCQYTAAEIAAISHEAKTWKTYVMAHAYTDDAIIHAVGNGVRSVEHCNLITAKGAEFVREHGAYVVPTLVTYEALNKRGAEFGMAEASLAKLAKVLDAGLSSLEVLKAAGVKTGFGTDLLGQLRDEQSREFSLRAEVLSPWEVICQATAMNAEILNRSGELGILAPGAIADVILVGGNPLENISLLENQGAHIPLVMKAGVIEKDALN